MFIAKSRSALGLTILAACLAATVSWPAELGQPFAKLPLSFEANQGQTDGRVKFLSRGAGYNLFLTSTEVVCSLRPPHGAPAVLRMKLAGSNRTPQIEGLDRLPGNANYFIGNDPKKWRTDVSTFARVRYRNVYPGIDVVYYGNHRTLENDFIVAPGTNPGAIALTFAGANTIAVDAGGGLVLGLASGDVRWEKPAIYQIVDGVRHDVAGNYIIRRNREVGFEVAAYDPDAALVIDPVLIYSSYLGGNGTESGNAIFVDDAGNAYITGVTTSSLFPTFAPFDPTLSGTGDVFVSKIDAAGSALVYSTYLGGSLTEFGSDISVDGSQNVYVTGRTTSSDFPTVNAFDGAYSGGTDEDAFVTRINAAGSALVYSTYLSGTFGARGFGIAANNSQGYAYVTGTTSTGFPVSAGAFEATNFNSGFLTKLCTNCSGAASLVYSTYLAHTGFAEGRSIAADVGGNAFVIGNLNSSTTSFASASAYQTAYGGGSSDAFVEEFNTNLSGASSRVYATYFGGNGKDSVADSSGNSGRAIVLDESDDAYIIGSTTSTNLPLANASQLLNAGLNDVFVARLDPTGSVLLYSTYLGGSGDDFGRSIAVNAMGAATVTGVAGPNFPVAVNLPMPNAGVGFVTKFNAYVTTVVYSTLLSGVTSGSFSVALDPAGNAFVTGSTNGSIVTVFPFQPTNGGGGTDAWVSMIADPAILGNVTDENGAPMAGALVELSGAETSSQAAYPNGGYSFGLLGVGNSYTVSVSAPNYIFGSTSVNNLQKNVRRDFGPSLVILGGQVTLGAAGLSGVTMTYSGGKSLSVQTDAGGNYAYGFLPAGRDYTVTPTKLGFGFTPTSRSYTNVTVSNAAVNFVAAPAIGEASRAGNMTASKGAGTSVNLAYTAACGATGHVVYRGTSPIGAGLVWNASYCGYNTSGSLSFDPGNPPPNTFWYFVVAGQQATIEGSYGRNAAGIEEPEAIGVGACDRPQNLAGICP